MDIKKFILVMGVVTFLVIASGCAQENGLANTNDGETECAAVETYGVDLEGNCETFPTDCLPEGYTKVAECEKTCNPECTDKCMGTTMLKNGECENGECVYATADENSVDCGYAKFDIETEVTLRYCIYSKYFKNYTFFLSVKTIGEKSPGKGGSVWLVSPEINDKIYKSLDNTYPKGIYWWQEVLRQDNPYKGETFKITDRNEFMEFDYKFVYCELENMFIEGCGMENGLILYSGNTASDCNIVEV